MAEARRRGGVPLSEAAAVATAWRARESTGQEKASLRRKHDRHNFGMHHGVPGRPTTRDRDSLSQKLGSTLSRTRRVRRSSPPAHRGRARANRSAERNVLGFPPGVGGELPGPAGCATGGIVENQTNRLTADIGRQLPMETDEHSKPTARPRSSKEVSPRKNYRRHAHALPAGRLFRPLGPPAGVRLVPE